MADHMSGGVDNANLIELSDSVILDVWPQVACVSDILGFRIRLLYVQRCPIRGKTVSEEL